MAVYSGAQMFDICDIANRAAVLVSKKVFFYTKYDGVDMIGDCDGKQHAATVLRAGGPSEEVES